jgi:hypothetical protein
LTIAAAFCAIAAAQTAQIRTVTLSGRVVDSVTEAPIRRALVQTRSDITPQFTDDAGRFKFHNFPVGDYSLIAGKPGYQTGARGSGTLTATDSHSELVLKLTPFSVVAGAVSDSEGDPVQGANVQLLVRKPVMGRSKFS